ncbi:MULTISPECIES: hypothetical protein [unclassified Bacillus (in: firmicutes)]|uniref:galactose-binding domain-containing protein n=2 Tax=Bacillus TaxID=1386 RepID=UPI000BF7FC9E|nr:MULTISPECIES: hypothetical protein [unclassified Bacillus (in: firmicutes)]PEU16775.1 hypothetical protein CN524_03345 [Bacillus sp. AFS019443]PFW65277.1 hypothetical protein COL20_01170 [Bacillus sp. AFS075034]
MISLARNGYTDEEVKSALHGAKGSRSVKFKYELLNKANEFKQVLYSVKQASIDFGAFNEIKRTARFTIQEQSSIEIDWLNDRIRPIMQLEMPTMSKIAKRKVRYIRDWLNGNTVDSLNHWIEIQAYDKFNDNKALNKPVSSNVDFPIGSPLTKITDGNLDLANAISPSSTGLCYVQVDLGNQYDIEEIKVWHSFADDRLYHESKLEISDDGKNWYTVHDSSFDGEYIETSQGKPFAVKLKARIDLKKTFIDFPLGIFLLSSPTRADDENVVMRDVEAYDPSIILIDDFVDDIYTVTAGTNYKQAVINVLKSAGITDYIIDDTDKVLTRDIQFDIGTPKMKIINSLLTNIGFTPIFVDENGFFTSHKYISPSVLSPEYTYKDDELSIIYNGMEEELDIYKTPNRWVIVKTNAEEKPLRSVYTNDNPDSPTSTVNRGRTIVDYREVEDMADQAALDVYTKQIADKASQVFGKVKFKTALMPIHGYQDILQIDYSKLGINEKFSETAWSMSLTHGGEMTHEARRVVNI